MIKRREFIKILGGAAGAWPLAAQAQQSAVPVIGFLLNGAPGGPLANRLRVFRQGLAETGIVEGLDATSEYRWAEQHPERLPGLAADLVRREVKVIVTLGSTPAALAAKAATATIPIVFNVGGDPVELGLVASLNRPGGNTTGVTGLSVEVGAKRLEVMHELIPAATAFAVVVNPATPIAKIEAQDLQRAAGILGLQLHVLEASSETDFEAVFAAVTQLKAAGLLISTARCSPAGPIGLPHLRCAVEFRLCPPTPSLSPPAA
jgi:putative ABC transport system substrate-binding protein